MRAYARPLLLVACLLGPDLAVVSAARAQSLYLPAAPSGPGGEDTIETASGARCRQSMNSNGTYLDVGMTGSTSRGSGAGRDDLFSHQGGSGRQATGYVRVTVPLGHKPERLDCSRLYELEIARMKREIELLKLAAE